MPNDSWYVLVGGQQYGPYPLAAMEQFVAEGRVTPQTMLRQGETGDWAAAGQRLDFSRAPAAPGSYPPGGFAPGASMGYAPPARSSRNTWIILAVVGGVGLLLLVLCLGVPLLWLTVRAPVREIQVDQMRQEVDQQSQKAMNDFENQRKEIEGKTRSPIDGPALKPDAAKPPVEAEPEPRSP